MPNRRLHLIVLRMFAQNCQQTNKRRRTLDKAHVQRTQLVVTLPTPARKPAFPMWFLDEYDECVLRYHCLWSIRLFQLQNNEPYRNLYLRRHLCQRGCVRSFPRRDLIVVFYLCYLRTFVWMFGHVSCLLSFLSEGRFQLRFLWNLEIRGLGGILR